MIMIATDKVIKTINLEYGIPKMFHKKMNVHHSFPPVFKKDGRVGEIAMLLVNDENKLWLMGKEHYPDGLLRIPTGGINEKEDLFSALKRELKEETSFSLSVAKFIGVINYDIFNDEKEVKFATYIFKIPVGTKKPIPIDLSENINQFRPVSLDLLNEIAEKWGSLAYSDSKPYYQDWGKFRAILHEVAYKLLTEEIS